MIELRDGSLRGGKMCRNANLFADIAIATGAEPAGAVLKYVGLAVLGREKTASGGQIVDPNE